MSDHITTAQITITRIIDTDGRMAVHVATPDHFNAVEMLGMLAMAQGQIYRDINARRRDDD